jgi:osmotically-inducible protein OsmY
MMRKTCILFFCVTFAVVMLSGCASVTGRTAGQIVDDSVITTTINAKIVEDPQLSYLKINVNSTEGHVVLTGFVPNREAEERLIKLAQGVKGVKSVKSELKIEEKK